MDADYSIELGPTAPALEIPWQDPDGRLHYVDLRSDSGALDHDVALINVNRIPEARQFPALARFLVAVNSPESQWQTAKCDVWPEEGLAKENLYNQGYAHHCYVDIVLAGQAAPLRFSLEVHQQLARELAQLLETNTELEATAEIVVRHCYFHHSGAEESDAGYCMTLFVGAYGSSSSAATECWDRAMDFASECVLKLQPHEDRAKAQELS